MSSNRHNEPINTWQEGDTVTGFALVTRKELRQDKNGRNFLDAELKDSAGTIPAKAWSDSAALRTEFEPHEFVAFKGTVKSFRDQLQLNLSDCRRVTSEDRSRGFDESSLIPSTHENIDDLWTRLQAIYRDEVHPGPLHQLAQETLAVFGPELREHPAAKSIHHAYRGGLLEHTVSMAELALKLCSHYQDLDSELILLGVLFHDLGKTRELGAMPVNEYTLAGRLVGHVVIGRDLLRERCAAIEDFPPELQLLLEHLILSHQGQLDFGSPVVPMTPEAFALHFIDDLDSKLAQLRQARESGTEMPFLRPLGRYIYLGDRAGGQSGAAQPENAAGSANVETDDSGAQAKLDLS
jgi:3'-5' exoribonuclease